MASLVLGAAGAAVGSLVGMPQIGWMIGSMAGNLLFPQDGGSQTITGQQLRDLRVQDSGYGNFIQQVYGTMRVSGNLIWAADLVPVQHQSSSGGGGGKGGGGAQGVTTVWYTYNASFAVSFAKGPISAVRRIWADGKLIYDARPGSPSIGQLPITVYLGTETQNADPTISAAVGAAQCPAYRGLAYVVFNQWDVSPWGNRIPSLSFEVVSTGATSADSLREIHSWSSPAGQGITLLGLGFSPNGTLYGRYNVTSGGPLPVGAYVAQVDTTSGAPIAAKKITGPNGAFTGGFTADGKMWMLGFASPATAQQPQLITPGAWTVQSVTPLPGGSVPSLSGNARIVSVGGGAWYASTSAGVASIVQMSTSGGSPIVQRIAIITTDTSIIEMDTDGTYLYVLCANRIYKYTLDGSLNLVSSVATSSASGLTPFEIMYYSGALWVQFGTGSASMVRLNPSTLAVMTTTAFSSGSGSTHWISVLEDGTIAHSSSGSGDPVVRFDTSGALLNAIYISGGVGTGLTGVQANITRNPLTREVYAIAYNQRLVQVYSGRINVAGGNVGAIIADLCNQCGMISSDYDVTGISALTFDGFALNTQRDAASWISELMQIYFFDKTERNGKLTFVSRGGSVAATLDVGDLAAWSDGSSPPAPLQIDRAQEVDLPKSIQVSYFNSQGDYIANAQKASRQTTLSQNTLTVSSQAAMTDSRAVQIANTLLYASILARTRFTIFTRLKWSALEPTDVISVPGVSQNFTMRIESVEDGGDGVLRLACVSDDPSIYGSPAVAGGSNIPVQTVGAVQPTIALLLDMPQLNDNDTDPGFNAAAYAANVSAWQGAVLYKSTDGQNYSASNNIFPPAATIGYTIGALANWTGGNIPDETSTLVVAVYDNSLASVTYDNFMAFANLALIGDEVVAFRAATLNSDGTYTINGLIRGLYGTERVMSSHVAGERFVVITASSVPNIAGQTSDLSVARYYKAVSIGGNLTTTPQIVFTNSGVRVKPYAPGQLQVGRDAANNATLAWTRRARWGGQLRDLSDVPLAETTESYDVEVWTSGFATLKRTFAGLSVPTVIYTSANQVTDFGANQATIFFKVYQNSSIIGRGFPAQGQG